MTAPVISKELALYDEAVARDAIARSSGAAGYLRTAQDSVPPNAPGKALVQTSGKPGAEIAVRQSSELVRMADAGAAGAIEKRAAVGAGKATAKMVVIRSTATTGAKFGLTAATRAIPYVVWALLAFDCVGLISGGRLSNGLKRLVSPGAPGIDEPPSPPETVWLQLTQDPRRDPIIETDQGMEKINAAALMYDVGADRLWHPEQPNFDTTPTMEGTINAMQQLGDTLDRSTREILVAYAELAGMPEHAQWAGRLLEAAKPALEQLGGIGVTAVPPARESYGIAAQGTNDVFQALRAANVNNRQVIADSRGKLLGFMGNGEIAADSFQLPLYEIEQVAKAIQGSVEKIDALLTGEPRFDGITSYSPSPVSTANDGAPVPDRGRGEGGTLQGNELPTVTPPTPIVSPQPTPSFAPTPMAQQPTTAPESPVPGVQGGDVPPVEDQAALGDVPSTFDESIPAADLPETPVSGDVLPEGDLPADATLPVDGASAPPLNDLVPGLFEDASGLGDYGSGFANPSDLLQNANPFSVPPVTETTGYTPDVLDSQAADLPSVDTSGGDSGGWLQDTAPGIDGGNDSAFEPADNAAKADELPTPDSPDSASGGAGAAEPHNDAGGDQQDAGSNSELPGSDALTYDDGTAALDSEAELPDAEAADGESNTDTPKADSDGKYHVQIDGKDYAFDTPEAAKLAETMSDSNFSSTLRDVADDAGFGQAPSAGEDVGVEVSSSEMKPGDVISAANGDYLVLDDHSALSEKGEVVEMGDLDMTGEHHGIFRLEGGSEALPDDLGAAGGDPSDGAGAPASGGGDVPPVAEQSPNQEDTTNHGVSQTQASDSTSPASGGDFRRSDTAPIGMGEGQNVPEGGGSANADKHDLPEGGASPSSDSAPKPDASPLPEENKAEPATAEHKATTAPSGAENGSQPAPATGNDVGEATEHQTLGEPEEVDDEEPQLDHRFDLPATGGDSSTVADDVVGGTSEDQSGSLNGSGRNFNPDLLN